MFTKRKQQRRERELIMAAFLETRSWGFGALVQHLGVDYRRLLRHLAWFKRHGWLENPDELGTHPGIYSVTPTGRAHFKEALQKNGDIACSPG